MSFIKATGAALNLSEMFINFPTDKLKMTCNECEELTGDRHRNKLVQRIFKDSVKLILNDIIDNNVTFRLPTGSRKCEIHMQTIQNEQFKQLRKAGKWKNIDFLKSLFSANQLGLFMYSPTRPPRIKNIYVNKELKDKIDSNTNNGKTYC